MQVLGTETMSFARWVNVHCWATSSVILHVFFSINSFLFQFLYYGFWLHSSPLPTYSINSSPPHVPNFLFYFLSIPPPAKIKTKKMTKKYQNKPQSTSNRTKLSMESALTWAWGLPWSVVDWPRGTSLKDADCFPPRKHQLWLASWLGAGLCVHFPFLVLGFVLFDLNESRSSWHALSWSLWVHVWTNPVVSERHCFVVVIHHTGLSQSFYLLFWSFLSPEERSLIKTSQLGLSAIISLNVYTFSSCESLY